jgi:hypothetical protein
MWQWNDETTAELRQMWTDSLTGLQICLTFQERHGICPTRSAVMGKVRRLDLQHRVAHGPIKPKPVVTKPRGQYKPRRKYVSIFDCPDPQSVPDGPALIGSSPGPLMSLEQHDCRFPVSGDGAAMLFCRDPQFEKFPYCLAHCRMAYRMDEQRKIAA